MTRYLLTLACGFALSVHMADAQIAVEDFDYDPGAPLAGLGGDSGGWGGAWTQLSTADGYVATADGLPSPGLAQQTGGPHLSIDKAAGADVRYVRPLGRRYADEAGAVYYLSSFQRHGGDGGSYVMLADATTFGAGGPGGQLIMAGKNPGVAGFGTSRPPQTNQNTSIAPDVGSFVVAAVFMSGDDANEKIYLFIDPALDAAPDTANADLKVFNLALNEGFDAIGLKATGPAVASQIDAIHVATTFTDVVPDDLSAFDGGGDDDGGGEDFDGIASESFAYDAGSDLIGLGSDEDAGWSGPWQLAPDENTAMATIVDRGLALDSLGEGFLSAAPSLQMATDGDAGRVIRYFDEPLAPAGGDFWWAQQIAIDGNLNAVATVNLIDTTIFSDTARSMNPNRDYQRVFVGKQFGNREVFAAGFGGTSGATATGEQFVDANARWIVSRMVATDDDSWQLYVWVDPAPGSEPDTANAAIRAKPFDGDTFQGVMIKTEANLGLTALYDDLYFGRTFAQIVPDDLSANPAGGSPAAEAFDYDVDAAIAGLDGGEGWGGAWDVLSEEPGLVDVGEGGINVFAPGYNVATQTNHGVFNNVRATRPLNAEFGDFGRTYWVGWFMQSEGDFAGNVANLVLASSAYAAGGAEGQLVQIGKGFGANNIQIAGGPAVEGATASSGNFVVAQVVTNGTAAPDSVYVWVNPDRMMRPSQDSAVVAARDLSGWNAIGVKVEGNAGVTARFDEIRVGTSYGDVLPDELEDVQPPGVPLAAVETFDYDAGADLDGGDGGDGWGGPWDGSASGVGATVAEGSLESTRVDTEGNRISIAKTGDDGASYTRPFFATFGEPASDSASVYVSFLHRQTGKSAGASAYVQLIDSESDAVIAAVGSQPGLQNFAFVYNGNPGATPLSADGDLAETVWVVMRLDLSGNENPDAAYVWVNPPADAIPAEADAVFAVTDLDANSGIDAVRLAAPGSGEVTLDVDAFRMGFSYRDISTGFGSDDPDLIAYEGFNYDAGTDLLGAGGVNAFWDGPWVASGSAGSFDNNQAVILEGSLDLGVETIGNKVEYQLNDGASGQNIRIERPLATPFRIEDGEFWMGFAMNTTNADVFRTVGQVLLLANGSGPANQLLAVGRLFGDAAAPLGIALPGAAGAVANDFDLQDDGTEPLFLVIQAIPAPEEVGDYIAMWVNPDLSGAPDTSTAALIFQGPRLRGFDINAVMVKTEAADAEPGYVTEFDEIRIGRTFTAVTGTTVGTRELGERPLAGLRAFPNPAADQLTIEWGGASEGLAEIRIFDRQGRVIAKPLTGQRGAGLQRFTWSLDGSMSNGIYFMQIVHGDRASVRRVMVHR